VHIIQVRNSQHNLNSNLKSKSKNKRKQKKKRKGKTARGPRTSLLAHSHIHSAQPIASAWRRRPWPTQHMLISPAATDAWAYPRPPRPPPPRRTASADDLRSRGVSAQWGPYVYLFPIVACSTPRWLTGGPGTSDLSPFFARVTRASSILACFSGSIEAAPKPTLLRL
jgi:hypothetical protein